MRRENREAEPRKSAAQRMTELRERCNIPAEEQTPAKRRRKVTAEFVVERKWIAPRTAHTEEDTTFGMAIQVEYAKGHTLMKGGQEPRDWIWCQTCGAHTNQRVRSLAKDCRGRLNTQQRTRLNNGCDPADNTPMVGATSRLCWHDLKGTTVELAIEMHRQKKKAEAQGKSEKAQEAADQEDDQARILFEQQRDEWISRMSDGEQYEIDNAMDWVIAYGRDEG